MLECPGTIRQIVLTDKQMALYDVVDEYGSNGVTATQLASAGFCALSCVKAISHALNKLHKKGYLSKTARSHRSGGLEQVFKAIDFNLQNKRSAETKRKDFGGFSSFSEMMDSDY